MAILAATRKMKAHSEMHPIRSSAPRETWLLNYEIGLSRLRLRLRYSSPIASGSAQTAGIIGFGAGRDLDQRLQPPRSTLTIITIAIPV